MIIGGGPAGVAAALEATALGAEVDLIEKERVGGNALWHSMFASKVHLHAIEAAVEAAQAGLAEDRYAAFTSVRKQGEALARKQRERIGAAAAAWQRLLEEMGVTVHYGEAHLRTPHQVHVQGTADTFDLTGDAVLLASGAQQRFPEGMAADEEAIWAPRQAVAKPFLPTRAVVAGSGATGMELTFLLAAYGCEVTLIDPHTKPLMWEWPEVGALLVEQWHALGVRFLPSQQVVAAHKERDGVWIETAEGKRFSADRLIVAAGRGPTALVQEAVALGAKTTQEGFLQVDTHGFTGVDGLFAAGDVTGLPHLASKAAAQGRAAVHVALGAASLSVDLLRLPRALFVVPGYAAVGQVAPQAGEQVTTVEFEGGMLRQLQGRPLMRLHLIADAQQQIVGAAAIGPQAAELIDRVAMAMASGWTIAQLRTFPFIQPGAADWSFERSWGP